MSASQRRKGARGERELLGLLRDELGDDTIQRNLDQCRSGGRDGIGLSLEGLSLEIKRAERPQLAVALRQAREAATDAELPAVAFRASRAPWRIAVEFTVPQFAAFIRERQS